MKRSYSLAEVAAAHLPSEWTDAERWLRRRLNRGELTGFRVGRVWRMTDEDVEFLTEYNRKRSPRAAEPTVAPEEPADVIAGLSPRARRRLRTAS